VRRSRAQGSRRRLQRSEERARREDQEAHRQPRAVEEAMTRASDLKGLWLDRADTGLILIDAQVKLAGAMPPPVMERVLKNWLALVETAGRMKMPVAVSEQYPQGLGHVMPVL